MSTRVITNSQGDASHGNVSVSQQMGKTHVKSPLINNEKLGKSDVIVSRPFHEVFTNEEREKFYTGYEGLELQNAQIHRVRELQHENDLLQREIVAKEFEVTQCVDPLSLLADIEHRQTMIARNTGEILKIYRVNEERLKAIIDLEKQNIKLNADLVTSQSKFIATNDMQQRTQIASEYFVVKASLERNLTTILELSHP